MRRGLLKEHATLLTFVSRTGDVLAVLCAGLLAYWLRFGHFSLTAPYRTALLVGGLASLLIFPLFGIYRSWRGQGDFTQLRVVSLAVISVFLFLLTVGTLTKTNTIFSRQWFLSWLLMTWSLLALFRLAIYQALKAMRRRGWNHRRVLLIGTGELGQEVLQRLHDAPEAGLEVVGCLSAGTSPCQGSIPLLGTLTRVAEEVQERSIDEVWIALPLRAEDQVREVLHHLRHSTVTIRFVPDIFGYRLLNQSVTEIAGIPLFNLSDTPMVGLNRLIKALEDRLLALLILVLISPLALLIAIGVKGSSPGPILFKQLRHGWDGRPIKIYKFRTMKVHRESGSTVTQASRHDDRVTPFGRFLRRTSLDELPQFFNVLQGRMSVVGPRPHAIAHNERYKEEIDAYMLRHKVKPGITGWAQVNGWRGETDTVEKMRKRVEYDLYYIEHWSLWFDLYIILLTLVRGFIHKNAY